MTTSSHPTSDPAFVYHFRGTWIPAEAHQMLADGKITPIEIILLSVIDSLSRAREEGCWAAKGTLAGILGVIPRRVQQLIASLTSRGLLRKIGTKTLNGTQRQILVVVWEGAQGAKNYSAQGARNFSQMTASQKENTPAGSPAANTSGNTKEKPMGFLPETAPAHKGAPTPEDTEDARYLLEALQSKKGLCARVSVKAWANEFRILKAGYPPSDVRQTLDWFIANITDQYTPVAYCAKTFRMKYLKIRDAIKRQKRHGADMVISVAARKMAALYDGKGWPGNTEAELPAFIQKSMDNLARLREKLKAYLAVPENKHRIGSNFARYLLSGGLDRNEVEAWVQTTGDWVCRIQDWKGSLLKFAFGEGERFDKYMNSLAATHGLPGASWSRLKEAIG